MSCYVLDTSALLAYIENEDGASEVEQVLLEALDGNHTLYVSVISYVEIFYISLREQDRTVATERLRFLDDLPLVQEPIMENAIIPVGELKASRSMSLADCCIAGLAKQKQAVLLHKDPEFEQVDSWISQYKLPYKTRS